MWIFAGLSTRFSHDHNIFHRSFKRPNQTRREGLMSRNLHRPPSLYSSWHACYRSPLTCPASLPPFLALHFTAGHGRRRLSLLRSRHSLTILREGGTGQARSRTPSGRMGQPVSACGPPSQHGFGTLCRSIDPSLLDYVG